MTEKVTDGEISARVFARMRHLRKQRKISAQSLADAMTALGCPVSRSGIANRENDRAAYASIDEVWALSVVLGVAIDDLIGEHHCEVCDGNPPARFTCTECGKTGRALPTKEWLRDAIADSENGERG